MRKKIYILTFICVIFLAIFAVSCVVQGTTVDEVIEQKKNDLHDKIDETTGEIQEVQWEISQISTELLELNDEISKCQDEINELNRQSLKLEAEINTTQQQLQQAEESYQKQKKLLEERIVAMYKAGETVYLDVLLNSKTLEEFISKYYYLTEITKRDRQLVDNVVKEKEQIALKRDKLLNQQEQLQIITTNKERTAVNLTNVQRIRTSHLDKLTDEEKKYQEKLEGYEKDMEKLEQDMLEISLSSLNEGYIGGDLIWPAPGYKTITSPYGMRIHPIFHVQRMHTGVDIGAPKYADIVAVNGGVVTLATFSGSYGYYVMIDHGGGIVTLYAHAEELCVSVGDIVKAGDVIMKAGSTGWSTGPHLHFEVRINGNTVNPLPYITKSSSNDLNNNTISDITNNNEIINGGKNEI